MPMGQTFAVQAEAMESSSVGPLARTGLGIVHRQLEVRPAHLHPILNTIFSSLILLESL